MSHPDAILACTHPCKARVTVSIERYKLVQECKATNAFWSTTLFEHSKTLLLSYSSLFFQSIFPYQAAQNNIFLSGNIVYFFIHKTANRWVACQRNSKLSDLKESTWVLVHLLIWVAFLWLLHFHLILTAIWKHTQTKRKFTVWYMNRPLLACDLLVQWCQTHCHLLLSYSSLCVHIINIMDACSCTLCAVAEASISTKVLC